LATPRRLTRIAAVFAALVALAISLVATSAEATPGDGALFQARRLKAQGRCDEAIALFQEVDREHRRPSAAVGLADCLVELGSLLGPRDLYLRVAGEKRSYRWDYHDVYAWQTAKRKADKLEPRIPTLSLAPKSRYQGLVVEIDGVDVESLDEPIPLDPGEHLLEASAPERLPFNATVTLAEGDKRELPFELQREPARPKEEEAPGPDEADEAPSEHGLTLGARFQGVIVPEFAFRIFGEGGATVFAPGGAITLGYPTSGPELVFALGYSSFGMGETAYRPRGAPDTDYEILESSLMALSATVDIMWSIALDDAERFQVRLGGSLGLGWTFYGDLHRTQAYPDDDEDGAYLPCDGPNDPAGSYRYCNELDKDAEHYDGYSEPSWFEGGARPLIYPWLVLPQLGMRFQPYDALSIDVEGGIALAGFVVQLGARHAL
jgi:hypothetical protein